MIIRRLVKNNNKKSAHVWSGAAGGAKDKVCVCGGCGVEGVGVLMRVLNMQCVSDLVEYGRRGM